MQNLFDGGQGSILTESCTQMKRILPLGEVHYLVHLIQRRDLRRICAIAPIGSVPVLSDRARLDRTFSITALITLNPNTPVVLDYREGSNTAQVCNSMIFVVIA